MHRRTLTLPLMLTLACADDSGSGNDEIGDPTATSDGDTTTGGSETTGSDSDSGSGSDGSDSGSDTGSDTGTDTGDPDWGIWEPGKVFPTRREPNARGFLDRRGLIHAHSVHSHDACDDAPKDDMGNYDPICDRDFREGLCRARHDFVFLTDHPDTFASTEYPDTLLYRPGFGDTLVEVDGEGVANWSGCITFDEGNTGPAPFVPALIQAGSEGATMPIGLPAHVGATEAERKAVLGSSSPAAIDALAAAGAVTLVAHTEDWSAQELVDLPLDGFEMYNLHANLFLNIAAAGLLLTKIGDPDALPQSDLVLLPLMSEDPAYLDTWAATLATGARKLTTMGSDCHRNTFPQNLPDGQRVDSYERVMKWFSNHLLVDTSLLADPQVFDAAALDEALHAGRLYGAFELLGNPVGFDFVGEQNGELFEIGDEPSLAEGALSLRVVAPIVQNRDPMSQTPALQLRLLRADANGWEQVGFVAGLEGSVPELELEISEPGAYRAEVRILPKHLAGWLGDYEDLTEQSFVWIYANPIYVRD